MPENKRNEEFAIVKHYFKKGFSIRKTAAEANISKSAVGRIYKKILNDRELNQKSNSGRPKKITFEIKKFIFDIYKSDHFLPNTHYVNLIKNNFNIDISRNTIARFFREHDIYSFTSCKKPFLSKKAIERRFEMAKEFLGYSDDLVKTIVFSYESKFNLKSSDGRKYVKREVGSRYDSANTIATFKHGGGSVMVWGCVSYNGPGRLVFIENKMTAGVYKNIIANNLLQSVEEMGLESFIFQQDNDPKHTSRLVTEYFETLNIQPMPWPSHSPDLNPIEAVWHYIKVRLNKNINKTKNDLKREILHLWQNIDIEYIQKVILSFKNRVLAVYEAKGKNTKY